MPDIGDPTVYASVVAETVDAGAGAFRRFPNHGVPRHWLCFVNSPVIHFSADFLCFALVLKPLLVLVLSEGHLCSEQGTSERRGYTTLAVPCHCFFWIFSPETLLDLLFSGKMHQFAIF